MSDQAQQRILARVEDEQFVDREKEMSAIGAARARAARISGQLVLGSRHVGKTEILLKSFDRLFRQRGECLPIFYSFASTADDSGLARDFLSRLVQQVVAFKLSDPSLLNGRADGPVEATLGYAAREDVALVRSLLEWVGEDPSLRNIFSAPAFVAAQTGLSPVVILDNVTRLVDETSVDSSSSKNIRRLLHAISAAGSGASVTFVMSGLERSLVNLIPADGELLECLRMTRVERLPDRAVESVIRRIALQLGVEVSDSTTELMVQQLRGDLFYIRAVMDAAAARGGGLKTFVDFEKVYATEVLGGRIGHYFGALLRSIAPGFESRRGLLETLRSVVESAGPVPLETFNERIHHYGAEPGSVLTRLHEAEMLDASCGFVTPTADNVVADYVRAVYRSEVTGGRPTIAGEELLRDKLRNSYRLMMSRYSRSVVSQLTQVLECFDHQGVPASLFDQQAFEKGYQGMSRVQIRRSLDAEEHRLRLPQIALVKDAGSGVEQAMSWQLFLCSGFEGGIYSEGNEVQWQIALINSRELVDEEAIIGVDHHFESALRRPQNAGRLSAAATRWYISKEGFAPAVVGGYQNRRTYLSTYLQLDLLHDFVTRPCAADEQASSSAEFELVVPIEDEAELIAARTVEQIARAADFEQPAINQIKTALIEACINAAEHGDSPDRRIYQRFALRDDRLVITVRNKGKTFGVERKEPPTAGIAADSLKGSRGRGLQIIRKLMDEVRFERTDDGSSLVMTKFLKRPDGQ